jgi:hypothetical protein
VDIVRGDRRRRLHKAFLRYHDANNWPLLRDALKAMGRADLIGNGKHHLIPTFQPLTDGSYASARRKNSTTLLHGPFRLHRHRPRPLAAHMDLFEAQLHADLRRGAAVRKVAQVHEHIGGNVGAANEAEAPVFFPSNERALAFHGRHFHLWMRACRLLRRSKSASSGRRHRGPRRCMVWPHEQFAPTAGFMDARLRGPSRGRLLLGASLQALAAAPEPPAAQALRATHQRLSDKLDHSSFGRPVQLDSVETADGLQGDVYAVVEHPLAEISAALKGSAHWCDVLTLHINNRRCLVTAGPQGRETLTLYVVRRYDKPIDDAFELPFVPTGWPVPRPSTCRSS